MTLSNFLDNLSHTWPIKLLWYEEDGLWFPCKRVDLTAAERDAPLHCYDGVTGKVYKYVPGCGTIEVPPSDVTPSGNAIPPAIRRINKLAVGILIILVATITVCFLAILFKANVLTNSQLPHSLSNLNPFSGSARSG